MQGAKRCLTKRKGESEMNNQKNGVMEDEYTWMRRQPKYQMYIDIGKSLAAHEETEAGKTPGNIVRYYRKRNHPMYMMMTEEEVELYDYYLGRDRWSGGDEAQKYLEKLNETLRKRQGEAEAKKLMEMEDGLKKDISYVANGFEAGLDHTAQNLVGNFKDEPMVHSAKYYEKEAINRDAEWGDKLKYNIGSKGGEMLPKLITNKMAGKGASTILSFANERGKVRQDVLRDGEEEKVANRAGNFVGGAKVLFPKYVKYSVRR